MSSKLRILVVSAMRVTSLLILPSPLSVSQAQLLAVRYRQNEVIHRQRNETGDNGIFIMLLDWAAEFEKASLRCMVPVVQIIEQGQNRGL